MLNIPLRKNDDDEMSVLNNNVPQVGRNISQSHTGTTVCLMDSGGGEKSTAKKFRRGFTKLFISTFNVKTLRFDSHLDQLEEELDNIKWDILGLSETRRPGEQCTTLKSGHLLYQNNNLTNSHLGGVGFLINKKCKSRITKLHAISDRVIYLMMKLSKRYKLQIIQVYAPTSSADLEEIEQLYEDIIKARKMEKPKYSLIIGDFNAKIGKKDDDSISSLGNYGIDSRNPRGDMLLDFLQSEQLYCMNTFFKKPLQRKWTWISPDGKTKNEIDFILSDNKKIISDVSVLNKVRIGSDHRFLRATIKINTKMERSKLFRKKPPPTILDFEEHKEKYEKDITNRIKYLNPQTMTIDQLSTKITESIRTATKKVSLQAQQKTKTSKISIETKKLIERRRNVQHDSPEYRELNRKITKYIRRDRRTHNTKTIKEIIENNMNLRVLRSVNSNGRPRITKMKNTQGTIVTDKTQIINIIETFYENLYSSVSPNPQKTTRLIKNVGSEEIPEITTSEIEMALKSMKNKKSPGEDRVTCEMLKMGGDSLIDAVRVLLNKCLYEGNIPTCWKNAEVILIFKKGDHTNIANYRPISLLSHLYKLFTKIITNRLTNKLDFYQPAEQAGFRKGFSTIDHLQTIKTLVEKCTEYNIPIHMAFVDYEKAFDSIEIWSILEALDNARVDTRYSNLLKNIYDKASFHIKVEDDMISKKIQIKRGVRQGDTISPKLFTLAMEDIFKNLPWHHKGISIDGSYLSHLRFADDVVIFSQDLHELQQMLNELNEASKRIGLNMNLSKTKIMSHEPMQINVNNQPLENVSEYIYLGHLIQLGKANQTAETIRRIRLSWAAFGKLGHVLKNPDIPIGLKSQVYNTCVLPVATYGLQTSTLTIKTANRLRTSQRAMERAMLGISLRNHWTNERIRNITKVRDVVEEVAKLKWSWAGHVARQPNNRWANKILHWRPRTSKRSVGRPQKRWLEDIKKIAGRKWHQIAQNREKWKEKREAYIQEWINTG